eukprot:jgi/Psemu1/36428/gm1.36428_g
MRFQFDAAGRKSFLEPNTAAIAWWMKASTWLLLGRNAILLLTSFQKDLPLSCTVNYIEGTANTLANSICSQQQSLGSWTAFLQSCELILLLASTLLSDCKMTVSTCCFHFCCWTHYHCIYISLFPQIHHTVTTETLNLLMVLYVIETTLKYLQVASTSLSHFDDNARRNAQRRPSSPYTLCLEIMAAVKAAKQFESVPNQHEPFTILMLLHFHTQNASAHAVSLPAALLDWLMGAIELHTAAALASQTTNMRLLIWWPTGSTYCTATTFFPNKSTHALLLTCLLALYCPRQSHIYHITDSDIEAVLQSLAHAAADVSPEFIKKQLHWNINSWQIYTRNLHVLTHQHNAILNDVAALPPGHCPFDFPFPAPCLLVPLVLATAMLSSLPILSYCDFLPFDKICDPRILQSLYTFYSNLQLLLKNVASFIELFPPNTIRWIEPTKELLVTAEKASVLCWYSNSLKKTIKNICFHLQHAKLSPTKSALFEEFLPSSGDFADLTCSLIPQVRHAHTQLLAYVPPAPIPAALAGLKRPATSHLTSACTCPPASPGNPIQAASIVPVAAAPAANKPTPLNDPAAIALDPHNATLPMQSPKTVIPGTNSLVSYPLVVLPDRIRVFPDINKTQLDLNRKKARPQRFKCNLLFNDTWSKQIRSLLATYNFFATMHPLTHSTSATSYRHTCFADGGTPLPLPTYQHQEALNALTTALATLGLSPVHLPANKTAITTIGTNQTVKFLCLPVTTSLDGDPHYLIGTYVLGTHLLFPCCAHSCSLLQLARDKSNWYHTTMLTGYCRPASQTNTLTTIPPPNPEAAHLLSLVFPYVHNFVLSVTLSSITYLQSGDGSNTQSYLPHVHTPVKEATPHLRVTRRLWSGLTLTTRDHTYVT